MKNLIWEQTNILHSNNLTLPFGYNFFGWQYMRQEAQAGEERFAVWKDGDKWSAGGAGKIAFQKFSSEDEAKKQVEEWIVTKDSLALSA